MLVDVQFRRPDPQMAMILGVIGGGAVMPERIGEGMYLCSHWSIDQLGIRIRERWREEPYEPSAWDEYGVCDNPEQVIEKFGLRDRPENVFVTFVRIRKSDQPADGGWRWRKWGEYIGTQKPVCEYIHDEPDIDEVYTFHIYEPKS